MAAKDDKPRTDKPQETAPSKSPPAGVESAAAEAFGRAEGVGPVGLEQIREILFGALFRELERRLARSDVHTSTRSKEIEQEARKRTEVLEGHLRTEIGALAARVEHAVVEAGDAIRNLSRENREALGALEKRIAKVEEAGAFAQRELRTQQHEQAKTFLDELQHVRAELLATLQAELGVTEADLMEERGGAEERPRH
jgi:hypothetical protein